MPEPRSWLLLVHHLPPRPPGLRVRVWRRLQRLGALAVKNSVYVLPASDKALEDFGWLRQEIEAGGGEAVVFRAAAVLEQTDHEIVAGFRRERETAYVKLAAGLERLERGARGSAGLGALEAEVETMRTELERIDEQDAFGATGRAKAAAALARCQALLRGAKGQSAAAARSGGSNTRLDPARYQGRLWVTRPRPHIDRCASAWLIRGFVDRRPRFAFAAEGGDLRGGIPFDMAGVEFGHHGEDCTFETLVGRFGLGGDRALRSIAEIVHDIDLKDDKFGRVEVAGVNAVLRGLADRIDDDQRLLREAAPLFDGLYASFTAARPAKRRRDAPRRRK